MAREKKKMPLWATIACIAVIVIALLAIAGIVSSFSESTGSPGVESAGSGELKKDQVLYDGKDMKVTYKSLDDAGIGGMAILNLFVENKTGSNVTAGAEMGSLSVNGVNITPLGGAQIQAGNSALCQIQLSFKQAGITSASEIKNVSMNLQLINLGSTASAVSSAPISINF